MEMESYNYFMISDGTYCHILPDKIVLGQPSELSKIPEMIHTSRRKQYHIFILLIASVVGLFSFLFFTDRMVLEVFAGIIMIATAAIYRLWLFRDTSDTLVIDRSCISSTRIVKRKMGYTTWVIFFRSGNGEKLRRMIQLYDSIEYEARGEKIIREAGLAGE